MKNQWLAINQLDQHLEAWQIAHRQYATPRAGWVKTLRVAFGMSIEQFATRLGLTRGRINQLEKAEVHNAITLRTLKEAANALECELIYAIVPRNNSTLENIIKTQAKNVAEEQIARVAHSMSLEAQSVDTHVLNSQKERLIKELLKNLNKKLWITPDKKAKSLPKLLKHLQEKK